MQHFSSIPGHLTSSMLNILRIYDEHLIKMSFKTILPISSLSVLGHKWCESWQAKIGPSPEDMHLLTSPIVLSFLPVKPDFCTLNISAHDQVQPSLHLPLVGEPIKKKHPFTLYNFCILEKHFIWEIMATCKGKPPLIVEIREAHQFIVILLP